jgi:hypothetical protein
MTFASFLSRYRRALALFGASALLHLLALWWVIPRMAPTAVAEPLPETVVARLIAAPPPQPTPTPKPKPAPQPAPAARPHPHRPPPVSPVVEVAALAAEPVGGDQGGAPEILAAVQSLEPASVEPVAPAAAPPAVAPPPATAAYRADPPPSARIVLDVARRDADGTLWHGEAVMAWQNKGDRYSMKVEAGIRLLVARVNLATIESEGRISAAGFVPASMIEKRRGRGPTTTRFGDGHITFSASPAAFELAPGAQDKATVPLQLAAIARADSRQLDGGIDVLVGEDRDASVFHFVLLGQEEIDTRLGKIAAWRLSRPPKAGAYGSRLDIWLAPGQGWLPVQIMNTEASGAVTTQTVNNITITDSGT